MNIKRLKNSAVFFLTVFACVLAVHPQQGTGMGQGHGSGRPDIARVSDTATLVDELKKLLDQYSRSGISDEQLRDALKDKYFANKAATPNDLFLVSAKLTRFISGIDSNDSKRRFQGHAFRLVPAGEFPEPEPGRGSGMGTGSGIPRVASREELLPAYRSDATEKLWTGSTLRLKTIVPVTGYGGGSDTIPPEQRAIPSPQVHYELAFRQTQPISLVSVRDLSFSLAADNLIEIDGPGIVAWLPDETGGKSLEVVFAIRLIPPYLKTEELVWSDNLHKGHRAIRHRIYADFAGIWLCDTSSGEVVSKNILNAEKLNGAGLSVVVPLRPTGALRILSKPSAPYTPIARSNGVNGTVMLRVTFLASGQIGTVEVIKGLPDGLTERAIAAARRIRFEPEVRNGRPVSVAKRVEYSFKLY